MPGTGTVQVADRLTTGTIKAYPLGVLGSGQISSGNPAPIVTATAKTPGHPHRPGPTGSGTPSAAAASSSPAAAAGMSAGVPFTDAGGLGIYDGHSSPSGIGTTAQWLGGTRTVKYAQDFVDATDWSHIENPWQLGNWKGSPVTMVWGVPMLPCGSPATQCATNVSAFDQVASGGADGYFKTLAQNLVNGGFGTSYIRLGWEFNGSWMGWSVCNSSASGLASWSNDFVSAFRNIVTSMRSVSGANFKFIWNPLDSSNTGCAGASLENFYPGDSYVDVVALDVYDGIGGNVSDATRWSDMLNGVNTGGWTAVKPNSVNGQSFAGYGLNWLAAFGKAHNKEVGLPEWGLCAAGQNGGGGDDAYFMTQMGDWIKANATGPAIFWNYGGGTLALDVPGYTSGGTPNATAAFRAVFGA
jgi:Glycosyl hydrolase family 26